MGKSFSDVSNAVKDAFESAKKNGDLLGNLKDNLFTTNKDFKRNSIGEIVSKENIDSYIPKIDLDTANKQL